MYYDIPSDPVRAKPVMQRFMQENAAVSAGNVSGRRRPFPPRSPIAQGGSLETLITWNGPRDMSGILGFNIYKDNEFNQILNIANPTTMQVKIKLPQGSASAFYISSYNALKESVKVPIVGLALSTQYVVMGTSGGTGGTSPALPPGYHKTQGRNNQ